MPGTLCCFRDGFAGAELICCHFYFRNVKMWRAEALPPGFHSFLLMNYHCWTKLGVFGFFVVVVFSPGKVLCVSPVSDLGWVLICITQCYADGQ